MPNAMPANARYGATILRVTLGLSFLAHCALKLFGFTLAGMAAFFGSIGLPQLLAYPTRAAELLGGLALIGDGAAALAPTNSRRLRPEVAA